MPAIGLDMGGTKCLGVVLDDSGAVVAEERTTTPTGIDAVLDCLIGLAARLAEPFERCAVGIGVPGIVDRAGVLQFAPHLPGVTGVPIAPRVREALGCTVVVDNDALCATHAEWTVGAGRGSDDLLMITFGSGIGAGAVVGGRLATGTHGFAGEIGHVVVDPSGPPCVCGRRGCWEQLVSGSALGVAARDARTSWSRGEDVTSAAIAGDRLALDLLESMARWLALGLANLVQTFDPERIVLGGGMLDVHPAGSGVAEHPIIEMARRRLPGELGFGGAHRPMPRLAPALLGNRAGAIGAALLAATALSAETRPAGPAR